MTFWVIAGIGGGVVWVTGIDGNECAGPTLRVKKAICQHWWAQRAMILMVNCQANEQGPRWLRRRQTCLCFLLLVSLKPLCLFPPHNYSSRFSYATPKADRDIRSIMLSLLMMLTLFLKNSQTQQIWLQLRAQYEIVGPRPLPSLDLDQNPFFSPFP